jgi:hypothetical protein
VLEDRTAPATLLVNSTADTANPSDPYLSLREAIAIVNSPRLPDGLSGQILGQIDGDLHEDQSDTIVFDSTEVTGPILLGGSQLELSLPAATAWVTIEAGSGVTVDGAGQSRVLEVDSGVTATLDHLTITHGTVTGNGGGVLNAGTLTVNDSTLESNSSWYGGGVYNDGGTLTVLDSALTANTGGGEGGGIYSSSGTVTVLESTLSANYARDFGGGILNAGSLTVSHSTLSANFVANYDGGGISNGGTLTVSHSTLSANSAAHDLGVGIGGGGGGIYNGGGTATVSDSTLSANSADDGGAILAWETVTVSNCTLSFNSAGRGGGAIASAGMVLVSNSTLSANSSDNSGGAIHNFYRTLTVNNCTFSANSAHGGGGAISVSGAATTVSNCTLSSNSATSGGGIFADGTLIVSDSTVSTNTATSQGGGIYNYTYGQGTVSNSTLSGNFAGNFAVNGSGGGIYNAGTLTVSSSTLSANSANQGGGIGASAGTLLLQNTLVAGNHATNSGPDLSGAVVGTSGYNLVGDGSGLSGISDGVNNNQIGTSASPIDPRLSPLGYYGGPTQTFALLPGSPARGAGDPDTGPTADQRGLPRVAGGPTDVGAFQSQPEPFAVTTLADPGRAYGLLSLREAVALANVLPGDNTVSFDPEMDGGLISLTAGQLELSGSGGVTTLDGSGRFTLDGGNRTRLIQVDPGTTAVLRGLALVNGNAPIGAGLYNRGTLTVADSVLYGNTGYAGGAVLNQGLLTLFGSTLASNFATFGAAIDNEGALGAYNSTLLYNAALSAGGALYNAATGTASLTSLTISRNSADSGGGIAVIGDSRVHLRNSIVAGNYTAYAVAASDITGQLSPFSAYNLIGTGGSGGLFDGSRGNLVGVADPGLTTPDFSSSQTPVFGFTADSPALGAGDPTLLADPLLSLDQHGNVRSNPPNIGAL